MCKLSFNIRPTFCSPPLPVINVSDQSLIIIIITGGYKTGGGATKWEGGHVKFYPYMKSSSHAEGGGGDTRSFGIVFMW